MSNEARPRVILISGPNGAGQSTSAPTLLRGVFDVSHFVNADAIARGLSELAPESVALEAGRVMLMRLDALAAARESFAFETTLASRTFAPRIRSLVAAGYDFYLIYLWVVSPELSILRIQGRVRDGGHYVDDHTVRQRYSRGLRNPSTSTALLRPAGSCMTRAGRPAPNWSRRARARRRPSFGRTCGSRFVRRQDMTRVDLQHVRPAEGSRIDEALVRAVRRDMAKHKRLGLPIAVWQEGKAVWLAAELIPVGIDKYEHPLSRPPVAD